MKIFDLFCDLLWDTPTWDVDTLISGSHQPNWDWLLHPSPLACDAVTGPFKYAGLKISKFFERAADK